MVDAFDQIGDGTFTGIELPSAEGEAELRPKKKLVARAIDLHGNMFFSINPSQEGNVGFNVLVDRMPCRAFLGEYDGGTNFETKDLGRNRVIPFVYPASKRTVGQHEIILMLGKFVKTDIPGKNDFLSTSMSTPYPVFITEGEEE